GACPKGCLPPSPCSASSSLQSFSASRDDSKAQKPKVRPQKDKTSTLANQVGQWIERQCEAVNSKQQAGGTVPCACGQLDRTGIRTRRRRSNAAFRREGEPSGDHAPRNYRQRVWPAYE